MARYVYCFTHAEHPLPLDGLRGVGAEETALRAMRHAGLAAVVSDAPEGLRPKRRDLVAHETVLETLCAAGAVVPMRFGTVAPDDDAVVAELARGARRYTELLTRLDGHVERNVKGAHQEDALLADLLTNNPELRARSEALRAAGGGNQPERLAFGEQVALAVEQRRTRDAAYVVAALRPLAMQDRHAPSVEGCFVNVSFLVPSAAQGGRDCAAADRHGGVRGPAGVRRVAAVQLRRRRRGEGIGPGHGTAVGAAVAAAGAGPPRAVDDRPGDRRGVAGVQRSGSGPPGAGRAESSARRGVNQ